MSRRSDSQMPRVIQVENLSKRYYTGNGRPSYDTFRDMIAGVIEKPFNRLRKGNSSNGTRQRTPSTIWALKDLNFEVHAGEVIGVVGRNGAGKSTLLKILSRITQPTSGSVEICGRSASLLEVGTGFHPELTGRENVYLNGAILGMSRAEIERRFDEIVTFAEVEQFMNTPIKRYSTGMYLRLAFAVAAHLRTEILFIDEVLAVGDIEFQRKCLGKVEGFAREGRTVMFVSHNLAAVTRLCKRALWLDNGHLKMDGNSREVVGRYFSQSLEGTHSWQRPSQLGEKESDKEILLLSVRVCQQGDETGGVLTFDQPFTIEFEYDVTQAVSELRIVMRIVSDDGTLVFMSSDIDTPETRKVRHKATGRYTSVCTIPGKLLRSGRYFLTVGSQRYGSWIELYENLLTFEVSSVGNPLHPGRLGVITPVLNWEVCKLPGR